MYSVLELKKTASFPIFRCSLSTILAFVMSVCTVCKNLNAFWTRSVLRVVEQVFNSL